MHAFLFLFCIIDFVGLDSSSEHNAKNDDRDSEFQQGETVIIIIIHLLFFPLMTVIVPSYHYNTLFIFIIKYIGESMHNVFINLNDTRCSLMFGEYRDMSQVFEYLSLFDFG